MFPQFTVAQSSKPCELRKLQTFKFIKVGIFYSKVFLCVVSCWLIHIHSENNATWQTIKLSPLPITHYQWHLETVLCSYDADKRLNVHSTLWIGGLFTMWRLPTVLCLCRALLSQKSILSRPHHWSSIDNLTAEYVPNRKNHRFCKTL